MLSCFSRGHCRVTSRLTPQASSWQWQVRDDALAAVAYGLPYLRSLALLSYDVQREGLMRLADMAELREVRFEMDVSCRRIGLCQLQTSASCPVGVPLVSKHTHMQLIW